MQALALEGSCESPNIYFFVSVYDVSTVLHLISRSRNISAAYGADHWWQYRDDRPNDVIYPPCVLLDSSNDFRFKDMGHANHDESKR